MPISTGTIYRIICLPEPSIQYIGSTFNQLKQRWAKHKQHYHEFNEGKRKGKHCLSIYPYFDTHGIENFKLVKIKDYQVYREHEKDNKHLRIYEQLWIAKTKNVNVVNTFSIKYLTAKDWRRRNKELISKKKKEYYENNKEQELKRSHDFYYNNLEHCKKRQAKYSEEHKEYRYEKFNCDCGGKYTRDHKTRHLKSQKHIKYVQSLN